MRNNLRYWLRERLSEDAVSYILDAAEALKFLFLILGIVSLIGLTIWFIATFPLIGSALLLGAILIILGIAHLLRDTDKKKHEGREP